MDPAKGWVTYGLRSAAKSKMVENMLERLSIAGLFDACNYMAFSTELHSLVQISRATCVPELLRGRSERYCMYVRTSSARFARDFINRILFVRSLRATICGRIGCEIKIT